MVQTVAVYLFALKLCVQSSLDVLRSELSFQIHVRITEITGTYFSCCSVFKMDSNRRRNILVDLLVMTFGISAWIGITGTYLQLPQIIQTAPEGWNLPSYIVILTQSGNIALLIYMVYVKWCTVKIDDIYLIYITLGIGSLAAVLMAFFYQDTIYVDGQQRSIPLFIFTAMFAFVGCLSTVLFMPFIGRFRGIYLVTYMFGQGLNGLLSSLLSLVQGVGTSNCVRDNATDTTVIVHSEPLFQPSVYFLFIFVIFKLSVIAFVLLNKLQLCKDEYASTTSIEIDPSPTIENGSANLDGYESIPANVSHLSPMNFYYLMSILGVMSFLTNGLLPGLQSFSCLSYGVSAYHLATTLSSIANPLACLCSLYVARPLTSDITVLSSITALLSVYILITAVQSPTPPLYLSDTGNYLIVSVHALTNQLPETNTNIHCSLSTDNRLDGIHWTINIYKTFNSTVDALPWPKNT